MYQIARLGEARNLTGKDAFITKVIADAGQQRTIRGQGNRRQRPPVPGVAPDQFGREMLRFRGTAAVAAEQHFIARAERIDDQLGCAIDLGPDFGESLKRAQGFSERSVESHPASKTSGPPARDKNFDRIRSIHRKRPVWETLRSRRFTVSCS